MLFCDGQYQQTGLKELQSLLRDRSDALTPRGECGAEQTTEPVGEAVPVFSSTTAGWIALSCK